MKRIAEITNIGGEKMKVLFEGKDIDTLNMDDFRVVDLVALSSIEGLKEGDAIDSCGNITVGEWNSWSQEKKSKFITLRTYYIQKFKVIGDSTTLGVKHNIKTDKYFLYGVICTGKEFDSVDFIEPRHEEYEKAG